MAEFSWSRLWLAIGEAVGLARGAGVMARRIIYWLVLLGTAPLADWLVPEHWLSLGGYALGLWMASVGAAFILSAQAIYTKQTELDKRTDLARRSRQDRRRRLMEEMRRIVMARDRIRIAQQLYVSSGMQGPHLGPLTRAKRELVEAVDVYAQEANRAHSADALVHGVMAAQLRASLDHDESLLSLGPLLKRLFKLYQRIASEDEKLDRNEIEMILDALRITSTVPPEKHS